MSVIQDVLRSYRAPRAVFQRRLGIGPREDRALAVLMGACLLVFAAQMPRLARQAHETGEELNMLMGATLLAWIFIMPLAMCDAALAAVGACGRVHGAGCADDRNRYRRAVCFSPVLDDKPARSRTRG